MKTVETLPATSNGVTKLPAAQNAKPAADAKKSTAAEPATTATTAKEAAAAAIAKFGPEPAKSPEERISRIAQFAELSKRYNALKEKRDDFKMFRAGNDKLNARITWKNAQGFEVKVENTAVIEKLTAAAIAELEIFLKDAEQEVMSFEI